MSAVGVVLDFVDHPLYAGVSLGEQHRAGALMWGVGSAAAAVIFVVAVWLEPRARGTPCGRGGAMRLVLVVALGLALVSPAQGATGKELFREGCSSCHGLNGDGVPHRGPSLHGVGAAAADFYLSTGRMPLVLPARSRSARGRSTPTAHIDALVAYVASLGGGPPVPTPDSAAGDVAEGQRIFTESCSGCHQVEARGGVVTGGFSPSLQAASTQQIYEAVRIGPWVMPSFDQAAALRCRPSSRPSRSVRFDAPPGRSRRLGHLEHRAVPEGMVTWLLGAASLLVVARIIGKGRPR